MRITGIIIFICMTYNLFCQNEITGRIFDKESGEPIEGATIIEFPTTSGVSSDSNGYFRYSSKKRKFEIIVTHVKYQTKPINVNTKRLNYLDIGLEIARYDLGGIALKPEFLSSLFEFPCKDKFSETKLPDSLSSFVIVEKQAEYPGGLKCLDQHIAKIFYSPVKNKEISPFGILTIYFDINKKGNPENIMIDKEVSKEVLDLLDKAFNTMKKWNPAEQRGIKFKTNYIYRLQFEH